MATPLTDQARTNQAPVAELARAAAKDAAAGAQTQAEKETLGLELYKEATGRFPQISSDRRAVYVGGFVLVGIVFVVTAALALVLVLDGKAVPEWMSTLATALGSGVIGGLFGYARQG